jgi:hypothetical protein
VVKPDQERDRASWPHHLRWPAGDGFGRGELAA